MITLHPPTGYNTYCGPTVVSVLLGITTDEAAKRIRERYPEMQMVKRLEVSRLLSILHAAGWRTVHIPPFAKSVETLIRSWSEYEPGVYLLNVTGHFITVQLNAGSAIWWAIDNQQKTLKGLSAHKRYLNRRIRNMYYLLPPNE